MSQQGITDRLFTIRYKCDETSHLKIKNERLCMDCSTKSCTFICPSDVYEWNDEQKRPTISFENCLECGTCRIACPSENIDWTYMRGGYGIAYRYG
nr:4Fe-4S dicluster domain-containing protein [Paenibacillus sp. URB8-2]